MYDCEGGVSTRGPPTPSPPPPGGGGGADTPPLPRPVLAGNGSCPACEKKLQVPDELLGKAVQCPECKHSFVARAVASNVAVSPSAPAPPPKVPEWEKKPASWKGDVEETADEGEGEGED